MVEKPINIMINQKPIGRSFTLKNCNLPMLTNFIIWVWVMNIPKGIVAVW